MNSRFVTFFLSSNGGIVKAGPISIAWIGELKMTNINVAKYLYMILFDEKLEYKKEVFFNVCKESQLILLWKILFETELRDTELLKERIYKFGSNLKEQDYVGREVFVCLVGLLHLVIK